MRMWAHCPRASSGLLPRPSDLVGYVRWDARFDQVLLVKQSFPTALQVAILEPRFATMWRGNKHNCLELSVLLLEEHLSEISRANSISGAVEFGADIALEHIRCNITIDGRVRADQRRWITGVPPPVRDVPRGESWRVSLGAMRPSDRPASPCAQECNRPARPTTSAPPPQR